jgi:hypothetical protein
MHEGQHLQQRQQLRAAIWSSLGHDPATITETIRCDISQYEDLFDYEDDDGDCGNLLLEIGHIADDETTLVSMVSDGWFTAGAWSYTAYDLGDGFSYVVYHEDDQGDSLIAVVPEAERESAYREVQAEGAGLLLYFPSEWQARDYDAPWFARALVDVIWEYQTIPDLPSWKRKGADEEAARLWGGYVTAVEVGQPPPAGGEGDGGVSAVTPPALTSHVDEDLEYEDLEFKRWLEGVVLRWRDTGEAVEHPETLRLVCQYLAR